MSANASRRSQRSPAKQSAPKAGSGTGPTISKVEGVPKQTPAKGAKAPEPTPRASAKKGKA